ncbi:hypothetical protein Tco_0410985 [Tanacetum coccineum]
MMTGTKFNIKKFDGKNDFALWQVRMKALLKQQGLGAALEELPAAIIAAYDNVIKKGFLRIDLVFWVLREITKETTTAGIWKSKSQSERIDEFHKLVGDLAAIDTAISDEDHAFLLLTYLPSSDDNFVKTLLYGWDTLKLEDVLATLNSRELQKMTEAKGDGGEGLYSEEHLKRDFPRYNHKKSQGFVKNEDQVTCSGADEYDNADVMMAMSVKELLDWIMDSGGSYHMTYKRDYLFDFKEYYDDAVGQDQSYKGFAGGSDKEQEGLIAYIPWTVRSPSSAIGFKTPIDMLRFFGWFASIKKEMLEPVKVKCIFLGYHDGIVCNKLWRLDDITSKVLQRVEFEVEPQEDHAFEVQPLRNVTRDREQHSAREQFRYREDSNEAAFIVAAVEKIYAYESLTFNDSVTYKVISKWKTRLKEEMDVQLDAYMLSNDGVVFSCGCKAEIWVTKGLLDKAKRNILGIEIIRDRSGNTLRVSQSRCRSITSGIHDTYEGYRGGYLDKETRNGVKIELKIVAGIYTDALSKAITGLRFQHRLNFLSISKR